MKKSSARVINILSYFCLILMSVLFVPVAQANDSAVGLFGGDLKFVSLKGVEMQEELLEIGPERINVSYKFFNKTKSPITSMVSFPVKFDNFSETTFDPNAKNPNEFSVVVDGTKTAFQTKVDNKQDQEETLIHHYWTQTFPPGRVITIKHSYIPLFEDSVLYSMPKHMMDKTFYDRVFGVSLQKNFCATPKQVDLAYKKFLLPKRLRYILTTAQNWDGPIKKFKLVIHKGSFNYIFLCTDLKLKKIKNRFEAVATNYRPLADLDIAYVGKWDN